MNRCAWCADDGRFNPGRITAVSYRRRRASRAAAPAKESLFDRWHICARACVKIRGAHAVGGESGDADTIAARRKCRSVEHGRNNSGAIGGAVPRLTDMGKRPLHKMEAAGVGQIMRAERGPKTRCRVRRRRAGGFDGNGIPGRIGAGAPCRATQNMEDLCTCPAPAARCFLRSPHRSKPTPSSSFSSFTTCRRAALRGRRPRYFSSSSHLLAQARLCEGARGRLFHAPAPPCAIGSRIRQRSRSSGQVKKTSLSGRAAPAPHKLVSNGDEAAIWRGARAPGKYFVTALRAFVVSTVQIEFEA